MADLTVDQAIRVWGLTAKKQTKVADNSAAQTVFKGGPLFIDASEDTANVRIYVNADTLATSDTFMGIAAAGLTVLTTDTEGDNKVDFYDHDSIIGLLMSQFGSFTDADLGKDVHYSDSGTLTLTLGTNLKAGVIHAVEDGYVYIRIVAPFDVA